MGYKPAISFIMIGKTMTMIKKALIFSTACLLMGTGAPLMASAPTAKSDAPKACLDKKLNEIQRIGSHNSYRILPPASSLEAIERLKPGIAKRIEYQHPPLATQLDLGLRLMEIDFYADSDGGRFKNPPNRALLRSGEPSPFSDEQVSKPGFKVMHIQGYDNYSHCIDLKDCLSAIKAWSDANPTHTLITINLNVKQDKEFAEQAEVELFEKKQLDQLDALLLSVFGRDHMITPDDIRANHKTLREAVLKGAWPKLSQTTQKFLFILDDGAPSTSYIYREGHPSLKGRAMFALYPEDQDEASFMFVWNLFGQEEKIKDYVKQGFLVRVGGDIGTIEARNNDSTRLNKAISLGAHYIASDYYPGHASPFPTTYLATFDDGTLIRCKK